jgi:hypothetical protein
MEGIKVLAVYDEGWTQCRNENGNVFFFNLQTDEVSMTPPSGAMPMGASQESQHQQEQTQDKGVTEANQPVGAPCIAVQNVAEGRLWTPEVDIARTLEQHCASPMFPSIQEHDTKAVSSEAPLSGLAEQNGPPAQILEELGDWMICEDEQGEFYWHVPSSASFDSPPAELLQLHQQHRREQDRTLQLRQKELRDIWTAKQEKLRQERRVQQNVRHVAQLPANLRQPVPQASYTVQAAPHIAPYRGLVRPYPADLGVRSAVYVHQSGIPQVC